MAKSLRQLTASYENMVRTQRQNADKIASGEWTDDDVFAEAFRQAAAYKGRSAPADPAPPEEDWVAKEDYDEEQARGFLLRLPSLLDAAQRNAKGLPTFEGHLRRKEEYLRSKFSL